jgi:hypothetical protein
MLLNNFLNKGNIKMYKYLITIAIAIFLISCDNMDGTAEKEGKLTEMNQDNLLKVQPPPRITWSLERDNLIKRFKLQNDRSVMFFMYVFIEGVAEPIGYYQVNKVSSVNSQLTNTEQVVYYGGHIGHVQLPSPAEDGSYGTNGDAVFGFTPEEIYIEHNMKYIVATVPLNFKNPVQKLSVINVETEKQLKILMNKINN